MTGSRDKPKSTNVQWTHACSTWKHNLSNEFNSSSGRLRINRLQGRKINDRCKIKIRDSSTLRGPPAPRLAWHLCMKSVALWLVQQHKSLVKKKKKKAWSVWERNKIEWSNLCRRQKLGADVQACWDQIGHLRLRLCYHVTSPLGDCNLDLIMNLSW